MSIPGTCYCLWFPRETLAYCHSKVLATVCGFQGRHCLIVTPRYLLLYVASKGDPGQLSIPGTCYCLWLPRETPLLMLLSVAPMCGFKGRPWLTVTPRYFLLYVASKGDPGLLSLTGNCYCQWLLRETPLLMLLSVAPMCGFKGRPWLIVYPRYLLLSVASKGDPTTNATVCGTNVWLQRETLANCHSQVLSTVCGFQGRPWLIVTHRYMLLSVAA